MVGNKDHKEVNPSGIRISGSGILDDDCMNQEINDNARSDQTFYTEDSKNPLASTQKIQLNYQSNIAMKKKCIR